MELDRDIHPIWKASVRERFTPGTRSAECTEGNTTRNMSCCTGVLLQGAYALALEGDKLPVTGTLDTRVRWILVLFFWPTQSSTTRRQVDAPCSSDPSLLTSVDAINRYVLTYRSIIILHICSIIIGFFCILSYAFSSPRWASIPVW